MTWIAGLSAMALGAGPFGFDAEVLYNNTLYTRCDIAHIFVPHVNRGWPVTC